MSLFRLYLTTAYTLTMAGEFALLRDYIATANRIMIAREGVIIPGSPVDKPINKA
jgi:hypothetical protein